MPAMHLRTAAGTACWRQSIAFGEDAGMAAYDSLGKAIVRCEHVLKLCKARGLLEVDNREGTQLLARLCKLGAIMKIFAGPRITLF